MAKGRMVRGWDRSSGIAFGGGRGERKGEGLVWGPRAPKGQLGDVKSGVMRSEDGVFSFALKL